VFSIQNAVKRRETSLASLLKDISRDQGAPLFDRALSIDPRIYLPRSTFFNSRTPHAECKGTPAASDSPRADVAGVGMASPSIANFKRIGEPAVQTPNLGIR